MIEVSKLLLLVLGELLLVGVVISLVIVYQAFSRRRRDRSAIRKLVSRIKEDSGRRESETRKIMQERFGFDGGNLEDIVRKIAREEKAFYQVLIDVYLHHKTDAIQNLCVDYESSVETYRNLEIPQPAAGQALSDDAVEDSEAYRMLKDENERLTNELKKTMDTMADMLSEYSQMFSGGVPVEVDREKLGEIVAEQRAAGQESAEGEASSAVPEEDAGAVEPEAAVAESADSPQDIDQDTQPASEGSPPDETQGAADVGEPVEVEDLDDLKELDEELAMLDLAQDDLPVTEEEQAGAEQDETVVVRPEESDEVVDLEDVLGDDEADQEKK